jgi:hypothetical protein
VIVEFLDPEPNGLAEMIGGLIEANLARHPKRRSLLKPSVVGISATDAGVSVTLAFAEGGVKIANGSADGRADLHIKAGSGDLLDLSGAPLRFGLPDLFAAEGRQVVRKLMSGQVRVEGLLRHPGKLARLTSLLSVT